MRKKPDDLRGGGEGLPAPGEITRIEPQVRRKTRFSVFIEGAFAFGLDAETVQQFGIREGMYLSGGAIAELFRESERKSAISRAFRFLQTKARSAAEVRRRLGEYGYPDSVVESAVEKCVTLGYINDSVLVRQLARVCIREKQFGRRALVAHLRQRLIPIDLIEAAADEAFEDQPESEVALLAARNQWARLKDLPDAKRKSRLAGYLGRKGFGWDVIHDTIRELERTVKPD